MDLTNWRLDGGIDYRFPTGTVVQAGRYLVVANDATALQTKWPEVAASILGNFTSRLGEGEKVSLKDAAGNIVDAIRVRGSGWSDGGGSSLELTDSRADHRNPAAWADSDESTRGLWETVTYRMVAGQRYGSSFWNEFRIGMLEAGEALVDDVSLVQDPDGTRCRCRKRSQDHRCRETARARFCYEMMGWALPDSVQNSLKLLKAIDRKAFGVHLDPCNLINSPERFYGNTGLLNECFDKLGRWITSCHAKDLAWEVEMNIHFREVVPAKGSLDYATYLRRLAELPQNPPLMIEHLANAEEYAAAGKYITAAGEKAGSSFGPG